VFSGLLLLTVATVAADERWRSVEGNVVRTMFQDKEFGDGVHFAYQFKRDGTFAGTEMGKEVAGSWRVRQGEVCWKWLQPREPERCYEVQEDGEHVRLMEEGSEARYGTLQKLP
jgi:hypothetical protein